MTRERIAFWAILVTLFSILFSLFLQGYDLIPPVWPQEEYSLVEVKFDSPLYIGQSTNFVANFTGPDPHCSDWDGSCPIFILYLPDNPTAFTGSGWPTVSWSVYMPSWTPEGRFDYLFTVALWKSGNRTVDVVLYWHLQFDNLFGYVDNRMRNDLSKCPSAEAEAEFQRANRLAFDQDWRGGYYALNQTSVLIDRSCQAVTDNFWRTVTWQTVTFGGLVTVICSAGFWKWRRDRRLLRAYRRKARR